LGWQQQQQQQHQQQRQRHSSTAGCCTQQQAAYVPRMLVMPPLPDNEDGEAALVPTQPQHPLEPPKNGAYIVV
jgi:hypothetical protein